MRPFWTRISPIRMRAWKRNQVRRLPHRGRVRRAQWRLVVRLRAAPALPPAFVGALHRPGAALKAQVRPWPFLLGPGAPLRLRAPLRLQPRSVRRFGLGSRSFFSRGCICFGPPPGLFSLLLGFYPRRFSLFSFLWRAALCFCFCFGGFALLAFFPSAIGFSNFALDFGLFFGFARGLFLGKASSFFLSRFLGREFFCG